VPQIAARAKTRGCGCGTWTEDGYCPTQASSITANFNGTAIASGDYLPGGTVTTTLIVAVAEGVVDPVA
jgi:hypothetical protein